MSSYTYGIAFIMIIKFIISINRLINLGKVLFNSINGLLANFRVS